MSSSPPQNVALQRHQGARAASRRRWPRALDGMSALVTRKFLWKLCQIVLLLVTVVGVAFPLFWMLSSSFKAPEEVTMTPPTLFPRHATVEHYFNLLRLTHFNVYFVNSLIVAGAVTLLSIVISTMGGYVLARHKSSGWVRVISQSVLLSYTFPTILLLIPVFFTMRFLRLTDSLIGLILTYITFTLPFCLMLLKSYFESIPMAYEEAATVDGASQLQTFLYIAFPMALPGIISTAIFGFIEGWNEFIFALVLINTDAKRTLPVGISTLMGKTAIYSWGMLMAGAVLATIPALIFFLLIQKRLVAGQFAGGVKG